MALPEHFLKDGLELAKGATIFGVPFEALSKDELLATAANGWKASQDALNKEHHALNTRLKIDDWLNE